MPAPVSIAEPARGSRRVTPGLRRSGRTRNDHATLRGQALWILNDVERNGKRAAGATFQGDEKQAPAGTRDGRPALGQAPWQIGPGEACQAVAISAAVSASASSSSGG